MTEFEKAVVAEVNRVRGILARDESLSHFHFTIEASGRIHDGEARIRFIIGQYSSEVKANNVDGAVREFMRRNGFDSLNDGLVLSYSGSVDGA